jgi:hypothetical protein
MASSSRNRFQDVIKTDTKVIEVTTQCLRYDIWWRNLRGQNIPVAWQNQSQQRTVVTVTIS